MEEGAFVSLCALAFEEEFANGFEAGFGCFVSGAGALFGAFFVVLLGHG